MGPVWLEGAHILILSSVAVVLKFLSFEQRALYFRFALGLANDIASSDWVK